MVTCGNGQPRQNRLGDLFRVADNANSDFLGQPDYRFWFLTCDEEPLLCMETTGRTWNTDGTERDLVREASNGVNIDELARSLLPGHSLVVNV